MAELADALGLGPSGVTPVKVQVLFPAPSGFVKLVGVVPGQFHFAGWIFKKIRPAQGTCAGRCDGGLGLADAETSVGVCNLDGGLQFGELYLQFGELGLELGEILHGGYGEGDLARPIALRAFLEGVTENTPVKVATAAALRALLFDLDGHD